MDNKQIKVIQEWYIRIIEKILNNESLDEYEYEFYKKVTEFIENLRGSRKNLDYFLKEKNVSV